MANRAGPPAGIETRVLDRFDEAVVVIDQAGRLAYANRAALARFGLAGEGAVLADWCAEPDAALDRLRRLAGSGVRQPLNLTLKTGEVAKFRGTGLLVDPERPPALLLVADRQRDAGFEKLRQLVERLDIELTDRARLLVKLEETLERETKLRIELAHRVKNNLALLVALINLRRRDAPSPELADFLTALEGRIMAMAAVQELAEGDDGVDSARADLLIEALCTHLRQSIMPDNVTLEARLEPMLLGLRDAQSIALLANELLTNALKHAFGGVAAPRLEIALESDGDQLLLTVADNGPGFERDDARQGTGSRLIDSFARQLRGELRCDSGVHGTRWQLRMRRAQGQGQG
ncbi:sensor histidine kinase [Sphingomicrobium astaxanthinifaciens]|uniref:sensor histidine kinase n=1 Tax=Sphingomicrobium astaxanthinifaciens TaxID=1227949 RepID=UPI001FCAD151|nr:sensor histidine kinase [Sphingomicrobium astaxanthinifaciens]MCJ7420878.1 sensor histidine kinase [Sphingomicrobium astaxanthinifaciens]